MKTPHSPLSFALLTLFLLGSVATITSAGEKCADPKNANGGTPESALKWAMSSAEVRQVMGQPDEIQSMPAPQGKAEIWVFSRPLSHRVEQMVVGTAPIMSTTYQLTGSCKEKNASQVLEQKVGETIQLGNIHVRNLEKIEVLLFNGHFVKAKITQQEVRSYN